MSYNATGGLLPGTPTSAKVIPWASRTWHSQRPYLRAVVHTHGFRLRIGREAQVEQGRYAFLVRRVEEGRWEIVDDAATLWDVSLAGSGAAARRRTPLKIVKR